MDGAAVYTMRVRVYLLARAIDWAEVRAGRRAGSRGSGHPISG